MSEERAKPVDSVLPPVGEILERINTKPLCDAIEAFLGVWREATENGFADAGAIYEAFCQVLVASVDPLIDVVAAVLDFLKLAINSVEKRERERCRWQRLTPLKPKPLLLDKRSKMHRCRNTC